VDIKYIKAVMSCLTGLWISAFGLTACGCHNIATLDIDIEIPPLE